jgi:hypothetical protein
LITTIFLVAIFFVVRRQRAAEHLRGATAP